MNTSSPRLNEQDAAAKPERQHLAEVLQKNVDAFHQIEKTAREHRTLDTKIADAIAGFCGSIVFVWVHIAWFGGWLIVNSTNVVGKGWRFDPPPFPMLTLVVSLEAIFLSTFILISQNRQEAIADQRNNLDLQINLLAEQENSEMMRLLTAIGETLGISTPKEKLETLSQQTDLREISEKLDKANKALGDNKLTEDRQVP